MNRSSRHSLRRLPPLRGRLAAIASPKLRTQYSQTATYTDLSRSTSRPAIDSQGAYFKLINSQSTITEDNNLLAKEELIDITLPVIEMEAPQVEVLEIEMSELEAPEVKIPEMKVAEAREIKIKDSPSSEAQLSKVKQPEVKHTEKSEQYKQAEKRLDGFIVVLFILLTIGSFSS